jgi:C4-dicarboxylate-specific signal transduction histidine kinase
MFPVEVRIRRFWHGDQLFRLSLARDISERKRAEQERERLHQLQAELAHINRVTTMGELTASLTHEVNQPITAAMTNSQTCVRFLTADPPNIGEAQEAALRAVKDVRRAAEIIVHIRQLFKKHAPEYDLMSINDLIPEMVVLLRGEAIQQGVSVRTELAPTLGKVMGDRVQLQQVLMNLMVNSIEAMKHVEGRRELTIRSQTHSENQLLVCVADTGIGLPPETSRLFDAFFTTKGEGTGMGLAISRSIVEVHGGQLWATSNSSAGASFYFTLPISNEVHP